ncbi:MAG TPA: amino acid adenylation domain-containing protein, partial [Thermoanaerobaculia bacterium]|nr:amino acid adenylation domain-containing protein [Thermoanaerobaculia bacterium]
MTAEVETLIEVLRLRAEREPGRRAYTFLQDGEVEAGHCTYRELDERARAIAATLRATGAEGDRVLLLFPAGLELIAAFFGCLYAGRVAVPAYPPRSARMLPRLRSIANDCRPAVALTTAQALPRLQAWFAADPEIEPFPWLATDEIGAERAEAWRDPELGGEHLAFLQYTSGSTSTPKGVKVTHGNLLHNQRLIQEACGHGADSVFVTWLPLYHDLGLIGNVLQSAYVGAHCVVMSPAVFLQRPWRWLEAISRYRATTSGAPNFAYDLCAGKAVGADLSTLDLRSWRIAFNGAEPVRAETLARFAAAFARCGFSPRALYPCYGLAEATLMVSGGDRGEPPVVGRFLAGELAQGRAVEALPGEVESGPARSLVGCGRPLGGQRVLGVDPVSRVALAPGRVGEIWVAGPSVAAGYWGRAEESQEAFGACLATGEGPFLRTGDLGFFCAGELYVTGRIKDLIILRGRNVYPQDVELTAQRSHPALRPDAAAAFSPEAEGEERLVLVLEVERSARVRETEIEEIAVAVRRAVAEEHEVQVYDVVLVGVGRVPRTTSGKIQRRACRALYQDGALEVLGHSRLEESPPEAFPEPWTDGPAGIEDWLRRTFAARAGIDPEAIDPSLPLVALGLDSLVAAELANAVETRFGVALSLSLLLEGVSLSELAWQVGERAVSSRAPVGPRRLPGPEAGEHPLSWGQRSLWFLNRLAPQSAAYNLAGAARLPGVVDPEALRRALQTLVDRHAVLRTTYADGKAGPVQRVAEREAVTFVHEEAAGWSEEVLSRRVRQAAFGPFDLERGPVFRAALFARGQGAVLVLAVHHIAADFASLAVLVRELGEAYSRETAPGGPGGSLPPVELRYSDFVAWEESRLAGPEAERLLVYWSEKLAGAPPLDLPADRPRPAEWSGCGGARAARLPVPLRERLQELARRHEGTLFMVLLAGFQALLGRRAGQEDFLVGVPTSGRGSERLGEVVGYLVNPVAVRADLAGDPTVEEWLDRVRRTVLGALAHQDLPFAFLAERLRLERDPSRPELFQALLAWQQPPGPALSGLSGFALGEAGARLELGRLELESVALESPAAQLDLLLTAAERNGDLGLSLQFSSDLFEGTTVERLLGHLARLLEGLTGDPGRRIAELPLLSAEERWQLLGEEPGALVPVPADRGLHELFEEQAARTPEAVALVAERLRLSYRELERRSRALALRLRGEGVGPEVRVAVCAGRTEHLVTALLAVLRAGGAYVPLDPAYPAERLAYLLADSAAPVLLTGSRQLASLPVYGGRIVLLDEPEPPERDPASRLERVWCHPGQLAYLIYTSGSTGRPKGVAVRHASAVARVAWAAAAYPAEQLAGVLAATSVCFDLSVFELFVPLSAGGTVILAEDVLALPELPAAGEVTLVNTVPSAMAELVRAGGVPSSVRAVNLAGEPLRRELVTRLYGLPGLAEVHNLYGPSEDTTYSTGASIPRQEDGREPAIGRPLPGTRVYLLDRSLELVPPGVPGELWIGGAGLARGYFGRPELTAERFRPDPLGERPGDRLYRTGDLVRRRPDGELEFLGRLDHQVKVRGFRVELGELEAALASHPAVAEAAALAVGEGAERRLVAYLELRSSPLADEELADFLRRRLPGFMVPSRFVTLAALPRMPNGKVDRKRLPDPGREVRAGAGEAPRTATERRLAELWAELLDVERVGRDDDFFALGGHSLLATRLVFRLRQALEVELPLRAVLEHTTLSALAAALDDALRAPGLPVSPPLDRSPAGAAPFLSFPQRRLWLLDRLAPGTSAYNMPLALCVRGPFEPRLFAAAWNEVVRRHEVLRTAFSEVDGEPVPVVAAPPAGPLPVVDLSVLHPSRRAAEALRRATEAALSPFDLTRGPVLRAALLRLGAEEWVLAAALHHIAGDAWSVEVLVRELAALYKAFGAGLPSPLPEPEIRYADFALWQRDQLAGGAMASQLAWWRGRLRDLPLPLDLPAARPRGTSGPRRGGRRSVRLPAALSLGLRQLGRSRGATPFMVLLAGFAALSARYTGATDVCVGTPVAGRSRPETEGLIGVFLNTLALRLDLSGDPAFGDLLTRVREETLAALAHQDLPFERLLEELRPERDLDRSPLFQVLFNQVDLAENGGLDLPGVAVEALELPPLEPKLDLTVYAAERGDGIELQLHYDASLFEAVQMERMGDHLRSLLEAVAGEPGLRLSELPLERAAA